MDWIYWILALTGLARGALSVHGLRAGWRSGSGLGGKLPGNTGPLPRLSIVVPARDEEGTVEEAMRTLLALDYPDLEIIAVDDRSTDRTGEILERQAGEEPRLRVIRVRDLPGGWLGKSHALNVGSGQAAGEWILFTDADVHFEPTCLSRAIRYAVEREIDHLVVTPEVIAHGFWERAFLGLFWTLFALRWKPSRVADPRSRHYIGVGSFNLVRAAAYRRAGGHAAMPMEVLDDVKLGKLLKRSGARPECVPGEGLVRVRWVHGVGAAVRGLTKNTFAAMHFNPILTMLAALGLLVVGVWPLLGIFAGPLWPRLLCGLTLGTMVWSVGQGVHVTGLRPYHAIAYPAATLVLVYILFRSMISAYARGGIVWRGTHYPLSELRKGLV